MIYLIYKMENNDPSQLVQKKVVLMGNTAVGKTSIFNQIISNTFLEDGVSSTAAVYRAKIMEVPGFPKKLKMNLWDTAGQEKFQSLTKMYVQDAVGVILVYDMTYAESLEGVLAWYKMAKEHMDLTQSVVCLVGNKCDKMDSIQVTNKAAAEMGKQINAAITLEVSAKDRINIEELFDKLAALLMQLEERQRSESVMLKNRPVQKEKKGCC